MQTNKNSLGSSLGPLKTDSLAPLRGQPGLGNSLPATVGGLRPLNSSLPGTTLGDSKGIQSLTNKSLGGLRPVCSHNHTLFHDNNTDIIQSYIISNKIIVSTVHAYLVLQCMCYNT